MLPLFSGVIFMDECQHEWGKWIQLEGAPFVKRKCRECKIEELESEKTRPPQIIQRELVDLSCTGETSCACDYHEAVVRGRWAAIGRNRPRKKRR